MNKRLSAAVVVAILMAVALLVARPVSATGICDIYTPNDVEYFLFFCYLFSVLRPDQDVCGHEFNAYPVFNNR